MCNSICINPCMLVSEMYQLPLHIILVISSLEWNDLLGWCGVVSAI